MSAKTYHVLFLCTGNSARSIMAEALLNALGQGRFHAYSGGSRPVGAVNPHALERLALEGIPAEAVRSKSWDEFAEEGAPAMDFVITVCDNAAGETCPVWPGQPITAHWGVEDPAAVPEEQKFMAFSKAYTLLQRRVELLASLNPAALERLSLENTLREIGRQGSSA